MTEEPFDDDEAVTVASSLEEAAVALDEGAVDLPLEWLDGIRRYARHVIYTLNNTEQPADTDMAELLLSTISSIGAACFVLGSSTQQGEDSDIQYLPVVVPASVALEAIRGGSINLRLIIE